MSKVNKALKRNQSVSKKPKLNKMFLTVTSAAALSLLAIGAVGTTTVLASTDISGNYFQGSQNSSIRENRRNARQEFYNVIEEKDYEGFLNLVDKLFEGRRKENLTNIDTEEKFDSFVQMHELYKGGDIEAADIIAESLDLPTKSEREALREEIRSVKDEIHLAFEKKSYEEYLTAIEKIPEEAGSRLKERINSEEDFLEAADRASVRIGRGRDRSRTER